MSSDGEGDDVSVSHSVRSHEGLEPSSGKTTKAPLRRGLACAFCRRRKLRCSAEKPSCYHCIKLKQECVYDQGKRGKIQMLEAKIAELSAVIQNQGNSTGHAPHDASANVPSHLRQPAHASASPIPSHSSIDPLHRQYNHQQSMQRHSLPTPPNGDEYPPAQMYPAPSWQADQLPPVPLTGVLPHSDSYNMLREPSDEYRNIPPGNHNHSIHQLLNPNLSELQTFPPPTPESLSTPSDGGPMYPPYQHLRYSKDAADTGAAGRLGEFLFGRKVASSVGSMQRSDPISVTSPAEASIQAEPIVQEPVSNGLVAPGVWEKDELPETLKDHLIQCYLSHHRIFFDMSLPRFYARLTLPNNQRPSPALLNSMYLWASRMSHSPNMSAYEQHFFDRARKHLDVSVATGDRIIDAIRAAMLLSAYSYSCGRHHEGFMMTGTVMRLVVSSGIHQIKSAVNDPSLNAPSNPFLRSKHFVLEPPIDGLDLGERIHVFWCAYAIDRAGSLATGFPVGIADADISTPFPRPLEEYEMNLTTHEDNLTLSSLYRPQPLGLRPPDSPYIRWLKCVALLDRISKIALNAPPGSAPSVDKDDRLTGVYREIHIGLYRHIESMGEDGINPCHRNRHAAENGLPKPAITPHTIGLHHICNAIEMYIYDVNSFQAQNEQALVAARRSVELIRELEPIAFADVDAFLVLVWSFIAKILVKETQRLRSTGDITGSRIVEQDTMVIIEEMERIGQTMHLARTSANAMRVLLALAPEEGLEGETIGHASIDMSMLV